MYITTKHVNLNQMVSVTAFILISLYVCMEALFELVC